MIIEGIWVKPGEALERAPGVPDVPGWGLALIKDRSSQGLPHFALE